MEQSILFIMNGIGSVNGLPGISGGDVRCIEIAKRWQKEGYDIHVLTSESGVKLCEKLGLRATFHKSYVPNEYSLATYLLKFLKSWALPKSLDGFHGIVYSSTEHMYDVLPALKIKRNDKNNIWVATIHWVAPLRREGTSWLNSVLFFFNQRMGFRCIRSNADLVFAVSKTTLEQMERIGIRRNTFGVDAGVNFREIRKVASRIKTKKYDAIFMKRFDGTKGVFDIIDIWNSVVKTKNDSKLGMIGLGTEEVTAKLKKMVETYDIADNVHFFGPIYDFGIKFSILASSELLVLPSYEENWGIVIGEAMAAGVPAVCYDLAELRSIWHNNVVWVAKGDKPGFAHEVLNLLNDENKRWFLAKKGIDFIEKYSWDKIADSELKLILKLVHARPPETDQQHNDLSVGKPLFVN